MLCLMFHAGCNRYSIPVSDVVEVLPYMTLQRWPEIPASVAGMFVYRSQATAVIDLQHLANQGATAAQWNTRVLILRACRSATETGDGPAGEMIGLLVGRVSTCEVADAEGRASQVDAAWGHYAQDEHGLIQRLDVDRLIAAAMPASVVVSGAVKGKP